MSTDNFSYTFQGEKGIEWRIIMENGKLIINNCYYEYHVHEPIYDFAIAMHKVINEVDTTCDFTEVK